MGSATANIDIKVIFPSITCSRLATLDREVIQQTIDTTLRHANALQAPGLCQYLPGTVRREVVVLQHGVNRFRYRIMDYDGNNHPIPNTSTVRVGEGGPILSTHESDSRDVLSKYVELHLV